ncbi:unnamed protein product [Prorocentrum cordatum]|uniref:Uncharacterized protein n=1 Tax=Prorocentrum cordatum TaxID=2364126 RepID=A0ABN9WES3_9DINO|nr:unnamed protein product [Polarella glacialis]
MAKTWTIGVPGYRYCPPPGLFGPVVASDLFSCCSWVASTGHLAEPHRLGQDRRGGQWTSPGSLLSFARGAPRGASSLRPPHLPSCSLLQLLLLPPILPS